MPGYSYYRAASDVWEYTRTTDFTFTLDLNNGDAGEPNLDQIRELLDTYFTLYLRDGEASGEGQKIPLDRFDITYENGRVAISGLPGYQRDEEDGTVHELVYYLRQNPEELGGGPENPSEPTGEIPVGEDGPLPGGDPNSKDYFAIRYDNAGVENSGGSTTEVYSGGKLELTLTGTTEYTATKKWLDEGSHPAVTFDLWRYQEDSTWQNPAPVQDADNNFIQIKVDSTQYYTKDDNGNDTYEIQFPPASEEEEQTYTLPKYTSEGYRYIYAVRESLEGDGADSYDPVFGEVIIKDGTETIKYDKVPYAKGGEELVEGGRADGDDFLYNGGTLTNRKKGTVSATVEKVWEAAAYQAAFDDVAVEFELERRVKSDPNEEGNNEDWEKYPSEDAPQTYILHDFYAEKLTDSGSVSGLPQYDAEGKEYEYRWVEVAVYQGVTDSILQDSNSDGVISQDEAKDAISKVDSGVTEAEFDDEDPDKITFTLKQTRDDGADLQDVTYISTSDRNGNKTTVTNRIDDKIDYAVKKVWKENTSPHEITLDLYQVQSGAALGTGAQPYVSITLTFDESGELDKVTLDTDPNSDTGGGTENDPTKEDIVISSGTDEGGAEWSCSKNAKTDHVLSEEQKKGAGVTAEATFTWDAIIQNLPQYDEDGHLYDYILLENTGNDAGYPTYVTERYDDGCYSTVVINGKGSGYRIMVQKVWMDDGDLLHREPVTLQAYYTTTVDGKETAKPIGTSVMLDGVWNGFIGLSGDELTEAMDEVDFKPSGSETNPGTGGGNTGDTGGGTGETNDPPYSPADYQEFIDECIYVVETTLGGGENGDTYYVNHSGTENPTVVDPPTKNEWENDYYGANTNNIFTVETDQHRYQVTYKRETGDLPGGANAFFTVTNRRLGNIDLTVEKVWNVGEDTTTVVQEVAKLLKQINTNSGTELALAFWLDFDNKPADAEWKITRNAQIGEDGKPSGDTVHVAAVGEEVEIKTLDESNNEVPASSRSSLVMIWLMMQISLRRKRTTTSTTCPSTRTTALSCSTPCGSRGYRRKRSKVKMAVLLDTSGKKSILTISRIMTGIFCQAFPTSSSTGQTSRRATAGATKRTSRRTATPPPPAPAPPRAAAPAKPPTAPTSTRRTTST